MVVSRPRGIGWCDNFPWVVFQLFSVASGIVGWRPGFLGLAMWGELANDSGSIPASAGKVRPGRAYIPLPAVWFGLVSSSGRLALVEC